jgi:signal peptidase I
MACFHPHLISPIKDEEPGEDFRPNVLVSPSVAQPSLAVLSSELLKTGYRIRFRASGKSMQPTIREGEVISVAPVHPLRVKRGDIVLYRVRGKVIAHRVIAVDKQVAKSPVFILRGDAAATCDPPVAAAQVLGLVVATERSGRNLDLQSPTARLAFTVYHHAVRLKGWVRSLFSWKLPQSPLRSIMDIEYRTRNFES